MNRKQECIPVGCVLSAAVAAGEGGWCLPERGGGVYPGCLRGGLPGGGVCLVGVKIQNIQVLLASEPKGNIIRSLKRLLGGSGPR